jgi:thiamine-monophosphate kinase
MYPQSVKRSTSSRAATADPAKGELALIDAIRRQAASVPVPGAVRLGIGDDCAVLRPAPGYEICVTTDFSLEDVHFRRDWHPPQSVGHRCLARGLSDLAAMGAEPLAVFLSLALPVRLPAAWLDGFFHGFLALARQHRVPLAGGDAAQSPREVSPREVSPRTGKSQGKILADIVALGQLPRNAARLRSAARPGDLLCVTGSLGGAAAELLALSRHPKRFRALTRAESGHPHLYPEPRLSAGQRLRTLATAMIDISDGLSTDLAHICRASRLAATLDEAALPIHPLTLELERSRRRAPDAPSPLHLALHGGEDYELLFTVPPSAKIPRSVLGVPVHRIGVLRKAARNQPLILLNTRDGRSIRIPPAGWEHFR